MKATPPTNNEDMEQKRSLPKRPRRRRRARKAQPKARAQKPQPKYLMGPAGLAFADILADPLCQGKGKSPKVHQARIPDGSGFHTMPVTLTCSSVFSSATDTQVMLSVIPPNLTDTGGIDFTYGVDMNDDAKTATGIQAHTFSEAAIAALLVAEASQFRIVSCGVNIIPTSPPDDTSAVMSCYYGIQPPRTGAAAYRVNSAIRPDAVEENRTLSGKGAGLTIRTPLTQTDWSSFAADRYTAASGVNQLPRITFMFGNGTTGISFDVVLHLELKINPRYVPFPVMRPLLEPAYKEIIVTNNNNQMVVSGHSFKSFFQSIGRGIKSIFGVATKFMPLLGPVISAL
jgi:hypothetical protein